MLKHLGGRHWRSYEAIKKRYPWIVRHIPSASAWKWMVVAGRKFLLLDMSLTKKIWNLFRICLNLGCGDGKLFMKVSGTKMNLQKFKCFLKSGMFRGRGRTPDAVWMKPSSPQTVSSVAKWLTLKKGNIPMTANSGYGIQKALDKAEWGLLGRAEREVTPPVMKRRPNKRASPEEMAKAQENNVKLTFLAPHLIAKFRKDHPNIPT